MIFSIPALIALAGVAVLALFPDGALLPPDAALADRMTLLFLIICAVVAQVPTLWRRFTASREAATWALLCVFFVLFHLADRSGPRTGISMPFWLSPDDSFPISYATRIVLLGALCSLPLWVSASGPQRYIVIALGLVLAMGFGSFWFLSHYYKVGATETLDPTPVATLLLQSIGYGALALCCCAVAAQQKLRDGMLRALPAILLMVWARHQFAPIPAPKEDE